MQAKRACVFVPDGGCSRVPDRPIYTTFTTSVVIVWSNTTVAVPVTVSRSSQGEATSPGRTLVPSTSPPLSSTTLPTSLTGVARPTNSASATMTSSPSTFAPASTALLTSTSTATSTSFTDTFVSPVSSHPSANNTSAGSPTHTSSSGGLQFPGVPSTPSAAPTHLLTHLTAPALAGTVASVALTTTVAAILVRFWVRGRRRARAHVRSALLLTQETGELGMPTAARAPCARIRLPSHASDGGTESGACTQGQSLVSGSSRGAQDGSAATAERTHSSSSLPRTSGPGIHEDCKGRAFTEQELPGPAPSIHEPPSPDHLLDRSDGAAGRYDEPQAEGLARSGVDPERAEAPGERLLYFALPWVLGQRVLAFIAREDARSVESGGLEELPAYEPRE